MQVFFGPPIVAASRADGPEPAASEAWVPYQVNMKASAAPWDKAHELLRLDFGRKPGVTIQVRNLQLRAPTPEELRAAQELEAKRERGRRLTQRLRAYLSANYSNRVQNVTVDRDQIHITGTVSGQYELSVAEVRPWEHVTEKVDFGSAERLRLIDGHFQRSVARHTMVGDLRYDRIYSKWEIVERRGGAFVPVSHACYPTDVTAVARWPKLVRERPLSKKGVGGIHPDVRRLPDLVDLGVHNITANMPITGLIAEHKGKTTIPFSIHGKTYHINTRAVEVYDRVLEFAAKNRIVASAIILVPRNLRSKRQREIYVHPDSQSPGIYSMANVTSPLDVEYYAAARHFLAERYSRPDKKHGRITHWIMHNEIDAWVKQKEYRYQGGKVRTVLLSEQGCNTPDYRDESQTLQAAGIVYAWKKLSRLDSIEAFHYHRWIDHEREGGLKLGLWTVKAGTITWPETKKKGWFVYQKLGTGEEEAACEFAKRVVGVGSFDEIHYDRGIR